MPPRILVADPDPGFGLMLAQMLEMNREYVADYVSSGGQALKIAHEKQPQLVIIDAALVDMTPPALIKALRQQSPELRVMVIPFTGGLPPDYAELNLQGTLPKPFFAGDLGGCIAQALAGVVAPGVGAPASQAIGQIYPQAVPVTRPVADAVFTATAPTTLAPVPAATTPSTPIPPPIATPAIARRVRLAGQPPRGVQRPPAPGVQTSEPALAGIGAVLDTLSREISAEALFVIKSGTVVAQRSNMNELRQESLSDLLAGWFNVAAAMAAFVGERGGRFKQLHFEGERFHIYGFAIGDTSILVAICRSDVTFGNLRLSIKSASAEIARYLR